MITPESAVAESTGEVSALFSMSPLFTMTRMRRLHRLSRAMLSAARLLLIVGAVATTMRLAPASARVLLKPRGENAAPLRTKALKADVEIKNGFATTTLTMTFQNEVAQRIEADFIYTVAPDAVVTHFAYWFGDEKVVARVVEKERAAAIYKHITTRMRDPALVEMIGKNTFRARIFPVMPNADLKVEMRWVQTLKTSRNAATYELPLRAEEAGKGTLDNLDVTVRVAPDAALRGVASNYNLPIEKSADGGWRLSLAQSNYRAPKDLRVSLARRPANLQAALYAARSGGADGFFALALTPDRTLTKITLKIDGIQTYGLAPAPARAVKAHQALVVCGRYKGSGLGRIEMTGAPANAAGAPRVRLTQSVRFGTAREDNNLATKLWAAGRIAHLSAPQSRTRQSKRAANAQAERNRRAIVALSTRFTLPSRFTSWLAVPREELERYKREMLQADMEIAGRALADEVARAGAGSKRARLLRARVKELNRRSGNSGFEYIVEQALRDKMSRVANELVAAQHGPRRATERVSDLRRQLTRLARATKVSATEQIHFAERLRSDEEISRLAQQIGEEVAAGRDKTPTSRKLRARFDILVRRTGQESEQILGYRLYEKTRQLATELGTEKFREQPDGKKVATLQAQLDRLNRLIGVAPGDYRTRWTISWAATRTLEENRQRYLRELQRAKRDKATLRRLEEHMLRVYHDPLYIAPTDSSWGEGHELKGTPKTDDPFARPKVMGLQQELEDLDRKIDETQGPDADTRLTQLQQQRAQLLDKLDYATKYYLRLGDPLISIEAPADARQVVAVLPGGEVKRLLFDAQKNRWEARFDIPSHASEGDYAITIIIVQKNGVRGQFVLRYRVDMTAPQGTGHGEIRLPANNSQHSGTTLRLQLDATSDTTRVAALLPWGDRMDLKPSTSREHRFFALAPMPRDWTRKSGKAAVVTYILTDRAHNRTTVTIDLSK